MEVITHTIRAKDATSVDELLDATERARDALRELELAKLDELCAQARTELVRRLGPEAMTPTVATEGTERSPPPCD